MKALCLPFSQIPHSSRLFTDFLSYLSAVKPFYPHSPCFADWMKEEASNLQYDISRRERVSGILDRQNKSWKASAQTLRNIDRLRQGASAIVTGQQVGLFGGPMFAIYKALTAVKLGEEATAAGIDAVPIFWLATYDHDLAEVNHVSIPGPDKQLRNFTTSSHAIPGAPVSDVRLGDEIVPVVEEAAALLGDSEVTQFLRESYRPGETLGSAFARFYAKLFSEWGVILLDASDPEFHRTAQPIYRAAIEHAEELDAALLTRGEKLEKAGYHQQVKVTSSSVLLFTLQNGVREAIHRHNDGKSEQFVIGNDPDSEKLSSARLLDRIQSAPEDFSPNVLLRPVVQDFLLPTLATVGGPAEVAYFAQSAVVYEKLSARVTPIIPRFSATVVEPKVQHWLKNYSISVPDTFAGPENLRRKLALNTLPEGVQQAFDKAQQSIEQSFTSLREALEQLDSTLVGASQTVTSKISYQLDRLRQLASAAELRRSDVINRHAEGLSQLLYPNGGLQEREIAGAYFVARYGMELLQSIHDILHTDCHDHQILEL